MKSWLLIMAMIQSGFAINIANAKTSTTTTTSTTITSNTALTRFEDEFSGDDEFDIDEQNDDPFSKGPSCSASFEKIIKSAAKDYEKCKILKQKLTPKSCDEVFEKSTQSNSIHKIDFDGFGYGASEIAVNCTLDNEKLLTMVNISTQRDNSTQIYALLKATNRNEELLQMKALIIQSEECSQMITIQCTKAIINHGENSYLHWNDTNGNTHEVKGYFKCNDNLPKMHQDDIIINEKEFLPITSVTYGPISSQKQEVKLTIGPLICHHLKQDFQKKNRQYLSYLEYAQFPASCQELKNRGFVESKEYMLDFDGLKQEKPTKAFCNFDEATTEMGKHESKTVNKCGTEGCFAMHVTYNSLAQVKNLMGTSRRCQQTIRFHCKKARINHHGRYFLTWRDVNGNSHNVTGDNFICNQLLDTMKMDIIEIKDKTLLPIKSVYYGPLESGQEATINVTPITCSDSHTNYLFHSHSKMNWQESRKYCNKWQGRLVRIFNQQEHEEATSYIANHLRTTNHTWIGLNDLNQEGSWQWEDNEAVTVSFWNQFEPSGGQSENCALYRHQHSSYTWNDYPCDFKFNALCEKL